MRHTMHRGKQANHQQAAGSIGFGMHKHQRTEKYQAGNQAGFHQGQREPQGAEQGARAHCADKYQWRQPGLFLRTIN